MERRAPRDKRGKNIKERDSGNISVIFLSFFFTQCESANSLKRGSSGGEKREVRLMMNSDDLTGQ